ncbi:MAG: microviridin/marinostatin family tricyclic proteinase inhibitor [Pseudomonadota bacterium]|nr:microviridin/marinostatin family tricyclic proteinase inhibitor [Pseudomonadota bacterium]
MNKTPFFSRFVEQQAPKPEPSSLAIKTNLRAGAALQAKVTLKYPSDSDESGGGKI